jgi:hypothetical protein
MALRQRSRQCTESEAPQTKGCKRPAGNVRGRKLIAGCGKSAQRSMAAAQSTMSVANDQANFRLSTLEIGRQFPSELGGGHLLASGGVLAGPQRGEVT